MFATLKILQTKSLETLVNKLRQKYLFALGGVSKLLSLYQLKLLASKPGALYHVPKCESKGKRDKKKDYTFFSSQPCWRFIRRAAAKR